MKMKSLLRQTEYNNRTVHTTVLSQMENIKEKMINCSAQAIQLQQSSQNRGEEAQEQIRIVQQDREDNTSELDSWTTKGRWPRNEPLYLIMGATGYTGSAAARELRKQGHRVRGLVHKNDARAEALRASGIEPVVGDLLDLDSIRRAMEGVAGAYFVYPIPAEGLIDAAAFTAQAAIEAGVQSLVDMSQKPARREAKSHASRDHWVSERVFDWSGIPTTHLRPTFFAEWLIYQRPGWEVKNGIIRFPFGRGRHAPIAAEDQGRVIAAVLTNPAPHAGKVYPLFGPVELDHYQIAEKLSTTLGRPFRYEPVSIPEFVTIMRQGGMSPRAIQHIASVAQDYQDGIFSGTNDVVERITGNPPLTLEEYVERNRANFHQPVLDSAMISSTEVAVT